MLNVQQLTATKERHKRERKKQPSNKLNEDKQYKQLTQKYLCYFSCVWRFSLRPNEIVDQVQQCQCGLNHSIITSMYLWLHILSLNVFDVCTIFSLSLRDRSHPFHLIPSKAFFTIFYEYTSISDSTNVNLIWARSMEYFKCDWKQKECCYLRKYTHTKYASWRTHLSSSLFFL